MPPTSPQDRLAAALSTVPDACREVLAWLERCKLRRRGDRLVLVLEVDEQGRVGALELSKRFTASKSGALKPR